LLIFQKIEEKMKKNGRDSNNKCHIEGRYANYFKIGQNAFEFVLEFIQYYPGNEGQHLHTRIITSPVYAKTLSRMLKESIEKYEQKFGIISEK
jgi:hypothetical protein